MLSGILVFPTLATGRHDSLHRLHLIHRGDDRCLASGAAIRLRITNKFVDRSVCIGSNVLLAKARAGVLYWFTHLVLVQKPMDLRFSVPPVIQD